jgi:hypothetical protein
MSSAEIKEDLHRHIEQMDERFLKVLHAMTHAYLEQNKEDKIDDEIENIPLPPWAQAYSKEELIADLKEADAQFDRGESITLEALKKESETW